MRIVIETVKIVIVILNFVWSAAPIFFEWYSILLFFKNSLDILLKLRVALKLWFDMLFIAVKPNLDISFEIGQTFLHSKQKV